MTKKWYGMNVMGKLSYIMAGLLFLVLPTVVLSEQLLQVNLLSPEKIYLFYIASAMVAAVSKQWKLFFGVMAGSLGLSTLAIVASQIIGTFF